MVSRHFFSRLCYPPSSGEIEGIDEAEGCGTSSTTRGEVTGEVPPELGVLVDTAQEDLLVLVFEGEVKGLSWEVTDHVREVTTPVAEETLLLGDTHEAIHHTCQHSQSIGYSSKLDKVEEEKEKKRYTEQLMAPRRVKTIRLRKRILTVFHRHLDDISMVGKERNQLDTEKT